MKIFNIFVIITLISSSFCFRSTINLSNKSTKQAKKTEDGVKQTNCIQPTFLSDKVFESFLSRLKNSDPSRILAELDTYYTKAARREMISPKNSIRLFTEVDFGIHLEEVLIKSRDHLWISSLDLSIMAMRIRALKDRATVLTKLFSVLIDHSQINLEIIRDRIDCKDKHLIETLKLDYPRPKDCFFGDLTGNSVFVIDLSGSMLFNFKFQKEHMTRLLFLKRLFKRAIESLQPEQKFQIVTFSTNAGYLFGDSTDMYNATKSNKDAYIKKVFSLQAGQEEFRFTNISEGLSLALKVNQDFDRIIFFTDGLPTVGIRDPNYLKKALIGLEEERVKNGFKKVPINTNLLMLGGEESADFRKIAKYYSALVAETTSGALKHFDSE